MREVEGMVFINHIDEYKNAGDYSILLSQDHPVLVINKFPEPILVRLDDLDSFIQGFFIKRELIDWICDNIEEFKCQPDILKLLLSKISVPTNVESYTLNDGKSRTELSGAKHKIEIWQDDFGSAIKVKDKKNRVLVKVSIYDKKIIATTVRNKDDKTQFIVLYPKTKDKLEFSIDQVQEWSGKNEKKKTTRQK